MSPPNSEAFFGSENKLNSMAQLIESCNVNQQMHTSLTKVLIQCLESSTFRTLRVHHQEDHLYMQFSRYVVYGFMSAV
jgi:two-component sensor histidine kinase